ncbi:MAG: hypothetical protein J6V64_00075, partial [Burkholderiaceae bacterium]|nr:hypothetical protein [Burkholderiaceae bacterium]
MFHRYGAKSINSRLLTAFLFEAWLGVQKGDVDEEGIVWVDGGFVLSYFAICEHLPHDWDRLGQRIFRFTYDSAPLATDICAERYVFTERMTGYFRAFQGVRHDPGSFALEPRLTHTLRKLHDRAAFVDWMTTNLHAETFQINHLCFELGEHRMLDSAAWAEILRENDSEST